MQNYAKSKDDSYRYMFKKLLECFTYGLKLLHLYHNTISRPARWITGRLIIVVADSVNDGCQSMWLSSRCIPAGHGCGGSSTSGRR